MNEKLNIITEKLFNDGVEKAKEEAEKILNNAKMQAQEILDKAKQDAGAVVEKANKESDDLKHKVEAELKLGGEQALASIKQRLVNVVSEDISSKLSNDVFSDTQFVEKLIITVADKWKNDEGVYDLNIILSEDLRNETEKFFSSKGKTLLDNGVTISFDDIESKGFVLSPRDGGYKINFTDEVFMNFFADYLRGFTKQLLFDN